MAAIPPPQGMSESDYETIEGAVAETVRGRWFLAEFARRNRLAETKQLLEAMGRLESAVMSGQGALPSADPSIRLLIQRIKEVADQLGGVAADMRAAGVDARYIDAVDSQARAVAGMMRGGVPVRNALQSKPREPASSAASLPATPPRSLSPEMPPARQEPAHQEIDAPNDPLPAAGGTDRAARASDQTRLAALSKLDGMTFAEKLALFT